MSRRSSARLSRRPHDEWWRSAVIYQVYPRSFRDSTGDGIGDLRGITAGLGDLARLGVDAVWLSPFMPSPQADAGYDVADYCDVDPAYGTLADADALIARAHELGLRIIVDLVPNHSSVDHAWFQAALAAAPGSPERAMYLFRDGRGPNGEEPPNNWSSVFGGPAWTRVLEADGRPGQWYLHLFDTSQPDFDWSQERVREMFRGVLRFWLDRGADGFRVDVAHGLVKADGLPDLPDGMHAEDPAAPYWGQEGVHEIYRDWRTLVEGYARDRVVCAEAWVSPVRRIAEWVRPDEMHQAFNFPFLRAPWEASALRRVITESLDAFASVGAPSTWVLSNHDTIRHASRLVLDPELPHGDGIGPHSPEKPDTEAGLRRARAATALMLALPGSAYLYQGEELGLPEVVELPDDARRDPTWFRSGGTRYGRDGARVPLPWTVDGPSAGFGPTGKSWLPQPEGWGALSREAQDGVSGSTLELYRGALALRREHGLGSGHLEWIDRLPAGVLGFRNGAIIVVANTTSAGVPLGVLGVDTRALLTSTGPRVTTVLPADTTAWFVAD